MRNGLNATGDGRGLSVVGRGHPAGSPFIVNKSLAQIIAIPPGNRLEGRQLWRGYRGITHDGDAVRFGPRFVNGIIQSTTTELFRLIQHLLCDANIPFYVASATLPPAVVHKINSILWFYYSDIKYIMFSNDHPKIHLMVCELSFPANPHFCKHCKNITKYWQGKRHEWNWILHWLQDHWIDVMLSSHNQIEGVTCWLIGAY